MARQPLNRSANSCSTELAAWTATRQQHRALRTDTPGAVMLTRWEVAEVVLRFWLGCCAGPLSSLIQATA